MLFKELSTIQCFSFIEEIMIYNWQIGDYEKSDESVNIISTIKKYGDYQIHCIEPYIEQRINNNQNDIRMMAKLRIFICDWSKK